MYNDLILVDIFDNVLGYEKKMPVHEKGLLHRAFSLFIVDGKKMLIQKRAFCKYHSGGLWANSCCSHPRKNEEFKKCVIERCKEEIGLEIKSTIKLFDFIYNTQFSGGLTEYELDNVYLSTEWVGEIVINKNEVEEINWIDIDVLAKELVESPKKFSSWFLICAPRVIQYIKNQQNIY